jgi:mannose-6-phosphate isomerase
MHYFAAMNGPVLKLYGKVQHYAWGGNDFIPELIGLQKENKPYAEYWMGAHPSASSEVVTEEGKQSLYQLIQQNPELFIGKKTFQRFGELPYLFKVLDVKDMLSIQVHPSKEEAIKGFEKEEAAGISLDAPHRNYKDKNHKPEVMVALTEFWLLHGFKPEHSLVETLKTVSELSFLLPVFEKQNYQGLYRTVMEMPQEKVDEVLLPLVQKEFVKDHSKDEPGYWVKKLYQNANNLKNLDRGIFSIYFFNIVHMQPGQAIFQAAGIPHAYLEGKNMELMANSDNVLRGGLTPKNIDVPELLKHTKFEATKPDVLNGQIKSSEKIFPCPVDDFGISEISLQANEHFETKTFSGEIFFLIKGEINISEQVFKKGEAFYALPENELVIVANAPTLIYRAYVPNQS